MGVTAPLNRKRLLSVKIFHEPVLYLTIFLIIFLIGLFVAYPLYKVMRYPVLSDYLEYFKRVRWINVGLVTIFTGGKVRFVAGSNGYLLSVRLFINQKRSGFNLAQSGICCTKLGIITLASLPAGRFSLSELGLYNNHHNGLSDEIQC